MALRPPEPRRSRRRTSGATPDALRCSVAAFLLVLMGLRVSMALLGVASWTISWRIVAWTSAPLVWPVHRLSGLRTQTINALTVGELLAALVVGIIAAYLLASLTVRENV